MEPPVRLEMSLRSLNPTALLFAPLTSQHFTTDRLARTYYEISLGFQTIMTKKIIILLAIATGLAPSALLAQKANKWSVDSSLNGVAAGMSDKVAAEGLNATVEVQQWLNTRRSGLR